MKPTLHSALLWIFLSGIASAQDWPNWRGPNWDGSASAKDLPIDFGKEKHVRWATELPGPGAATPIVAGDFVLVSAANEGEKQLLAIMLSRATGEVVWERAAGSGYKPADQGETTRLDYRANYAAPSPVTDGERAIFFFGNGDLVAFDRAGEELWRRNIQKDHGDFAFQWSFSASPTLWEGTLFLPVLQRNVPVGKRGEEGAHSFLLAMDPSTGKTIWEHDRASEARNESRESYATAIPHVGAGGRKELLVVGGDVITGHDPKTGAEIWRWGTWNSEHREEWWRVVPSVVVGGGAALVCAPKNAPVYAVKLDGEGELGEKGLIWKSQGRPNPLTSDVPTPLFYEDRFYVLSDLQESLSCVDPKSGDIYWTIKMPGQHLWRASPTGADGKVWCMNHHGDVVVVDATSGEILANVAMGEADDDDTCSSIAIAGGDLYVRTNTKLYCIGKPR